MNPEPARPGGINAVLVRLGLFAWIAAGVLLLVGAVRNVRLRAAVPAASAARAQLRQPVLPVRVPPAERRYRSEYDLRTGDEMVFVLVGASFCGAHRKEGFPQAIEDAKVEIQRQAKARGWQFRAVGVSLDWKPKDALAFLDAFGEFDELSVGSNWVNDSAVRYVWRDIPGDPVVPQVLVLQRRVDAEQRTVRVSGERLIRRVRGSDDILAWARSGAPL